MGVMKMKEGLKSAAMEYGGQSMLEAGMLTMLQLSVGSSDISNTQVSHRLHIIYNMHTILRLV